LKVTAPELAFYERRAGTVAERKKERNMLLLKGNGKEEMPAVLNSSNRRK
jgi:hypothetical protein